MLDFQIMGGVNGYPSRAANIITHTNNILGWVHSKISMSTVQSDDLVFTDSSRIVRSGEML